MRKLVCLVVTCLAVAGCSKKSTAVADMGIRHVNIHTMDDNNPRATALAVQGDKILWVGDDKDAGQYIGERTRVVDAGGRLLLPGFIDSHFYFSLGNDPNGCRLSSHPVE